MSKPVLSFCIPTFNMILYIPELLESIESEVISFPDQLFEICISDNCSTDNTLFFFRNYVSPFENLSIVYFRSESNLGADRNFLKAVSISSGKYCWLLGADDRLKKGALTLLLSKVLNRNCDIFLGDRENIDLYGNSISFEFWSSNQQIISKNELPRYIDSIKSIGGLFSYLSCILFKRESWDLSIQSLDFDRFLCSNYIHTLILLNIIKKDKAMHYFHNTIVQARRGNDSFLDKGYLNRIKIDYGYIDIVYYLFPEDIVLSKSIKSLLKRERNIFHFLKSACLSGKSETYEFMKQNSLLTRYIIKVFPVFFIRILLKIYHKG
ncbi:glycosyltransferase family 2 protein [Marinomonas sp. RSW2]|uniref:Glycosyltransferase family 2 protein n=1 Tax=Marinomonas maritima TaxID=2940935 RepID=A0ABT5WA81_9GAMM|nr:glycosyltransferase family 2 protein [Marinomonas maritima]MDE8601622.1 glycosyltransferase family 2 protein [Marinomonas maritima]